MQKILGLGIGGLFLIACAANSTTPGMVAKQNAAAAAAKQVRDGRVYKANQADLYSAVMVTLLENDFSLEEQNDENFSLRTRQRRMEGWAAFFPSRPNQYSVDLQIEAAIEPDTEGGSRAKIKAQYVGPQRQWEPVKEAQFYNFLYTEVGRTLKRRILPPDVNMGYNSVYTPGR